jgi:hypothetical protein
MLFCWRFEPGERQWTLYDYFPLLPADDPRCRDGNDFYRKPADDLDSTSKMYGGDGTGMQASGSWRWTMPAT